MPTGWFDSDVNELVSDRILKDIAEFWELLNAPLKVAQ